MGEETAGRRGFALPEASTVTMLRQRNRALVLKHIILAQETTRAAIAKASGLSTASTTNLVTELLDEGLVEERGSRSSQGGRPIAILGPRADSAITIGADVGERGVAIEIFDLAMNRIDREFRGGREQETPTMIAADIRDALDALRQRNLERWPTLLGVGLGLPGLVETHADGGQTLFAQSLGWPPVAIDDLCTVDGVPVFAENGAKMQTRAELWFGQARGLRHALVALLGRGIGLGVIADGELSRGAVSSAGEWGHTVIERAGRICRCGNLGCVEAYLGADAILERWREQGGEFEGSGWNAVGELVAQARAGVHEADMVLTAVIDDLGSALGSMVNLTNPERIVVGGWVGLRLMESHPAELAAAVRRHSLARLGEQFDVKPAQFGGDSVALGAALLPLEALIAADRSVA